MLSQAIGIYKVYPLLGRYLAEKDLGKSIIRVFPHRVDYVHNFSYVPLNERPEAIYRASVKLLAIKQRCLEVENEHSQSLLSEELSTDCHWVTVEELTQHLQRYPRAGIEFNYLRDVPWSFHVVKTGTFDPLPFYIVARKLMDKKT